MKVVGVSMVRNEEEIVEAFVRHNLSILDGLLVVVDGLSTDRTLAILKALCAERLSLVVMRGESAESRSAETLSTAARHVLQHAGADFVFPIGADEFLKVPSREGLEKALMSIPSGYVGRAVARTYVPPLDDVAIRDMRGVLGSAGRLSGDDATREHAAGKVVLTIEFAGVADAFLKPGNSDVVVGRDQATAWSVRQFDLPSQAVEVCRVPVRTRAQYIARTAEYGLERIAAGNAPPPGSNRRSEFERLRDGEHPDAGTMLRRHVERGFANGIPSAGAPETVVDPFLVEFELRHTPPPRTDPLPVVVQTVERMARRLAEARDAGVLPAPSGAPGPA